MSDPFLGEIRAVGFNFAPMGWACCYGQQMTLAQNSALFSLFGIQFGGNGTTTFNLPDLRGRCIIGQGQGPGLSNMVMGQSAGRENTQLQVANMPLHNHTATISGTGAITFKMSGDQADSNDPTGAMFAKVKSGTNFQNAYDKTPSTVITMSPDSATLDTSKLTASISNTGSGAAFSIMQPYLVLNYIIATQGLYPTRD
ncbi:phage tail protein [Clostridium scatologenes]|uniref:Phage Tail Collar n=1 Tax=Clostridium scatologenes TaxID=1548 RepID=A0A0E3M7K5_CLOSL|nr:tail fiber protein [Clostridium scatologenes]AKA68907.1 Phage Tail Collar [Clostridium scatologenes]